MSPLDTHPLDDYESAAAVAVETMCKRVGYGRMQQIIGNLWEKAHDCAPRGRMGVTIDDRLPRLPKPSRFRREMRNDGGYNMIPAYTEAEMRSYAIAAMEARQEFANFGLTIAIQHLNSNPYNLTKDECIKLLRKVRDGNKS